MEPKFSKATDFIRAGDVAGLRAELAANPALATAASSTGPPSLLQMVAVDSGLGKVPNAVDLAKVLIEYGAEPDEALVAAASTNSRHMVDYFLEEGATLGGRPWDALDESLYWSHRELAEDLVARGAPVNSLRAAAGMGDLSRLENILSGGSNAGPVRCPFPDRATEPAASDPQHVLDNAFVTAILNRRLDAAEWLLENGSNINNKPCGFHWAGCALHAAIWRDDPAAVHWLLDRGADPKIRDDEYEDDAFGWANHFENSTILAILKER